MDALARSYVGAERCKLCHRQVYLSWLGTPHARESWREDPATGAEPSEACLRCHSTDGARLRPVQCEACHGPGSDYSPAEVMIDPEKTVLAGLEFPGRATCLRCHEHDEPGHPPARPLPPREAWSESVHVLEEP